MKTSKILKILKEKAPCNLVLCGPEGMGKEAAAFELAASWLHVKEEDLIVHPDCKIIRAEDGTIRSERAEEIRNMASFVTQQKEICIVLDAQKMTPDLQNKLLKALEDGANELAVIFITEEPLLETLQSRCTMVLFHRLSDEELYLYVNDPVPALVLASGGSPGVYESLVNDHEFSVYLEGIYQMLTRLKERKETREILRATNALLEKDKEYLPAKLEEAQMAAFLCMVRSLFYYVLLKQQHVCIPSWLQLGKLSEVYTKHEAMACYRAADKAIRMQKKKGAFTRNDFFEFLMELILI